MKAEILAWNQAIRMLGLSLAYTQNDTLLACIGHFGNNEKSVNLWWLNHFGYKLHNMLSFDSFIEWLLVVEVIC